MRSSAISRERPPTQRFAFGENWQRFLIRLDGTAIERAERSIRRILGRERLDGCRFLDIGSGSGLFSLAARQLGAVVSSFDDDPQSVACAVELKRRFFADDPHWTISQGSILDATMVERLGRFDIVYAWGVLHHTGDMWAALAQTLGRVEPEGLLCLALYNDQGRASRRWTAVKRLYQRLPAILRPALLGAAFLRLWLPTLLRDALRGNPLRSWRVYGTERGMSPWRDVVDWVGGWPFQVAKPEEVLDACRAEGFVLLRLKTCAGGLGCNEYVFQAPPMSRFPA